METRVEESFINKKTMARLAVVQALYQYEMNDRKDDANHLCNVLGALYNDQDYQTELSSNAKLKISKNHFTSLLKLTISDLLSIDEIIASYLIQKRELTDITLVSILRAGMTELKHYPDIPFKSIVNDYTNIAESMCDEGDIGFINSMLHKYAVSLGYATTEHTE